MAKTTIIIKTQYGSFSCVFEPEPDMGGYMVTVLKLPAAITWGKTLAHAKKMAKEVIECVIEGNIIVAAEKSGQITIKNHSVNIA